MIISNVLITGGLLLNMSHGEISAQPSEEELMLCYRFHAKVVQNVQILIWKWHHNTYSKCLPVHDDSMNTQWFCIFIWKLIWHLFQSEVELSGRSEQYFPCCLLQCWSIWLITRRLNRVFRCAIGGVASVLPAYHIVFRFEVLTV